MGYLIWLAGAKLQTQNDGSASHHLSFLPKKFRWNEPTNF
jgi:hypothetical protein